MLIKMSLHSIYLLHLLFGLRQHLEIQVREPDSVWLMIYGYSYLCIFIQKQKYKQPIDTQCCLL